MVWNLQQLLRDEALAEELECERTLRAAAITLGNAPPNEISSTAVVGALGCDDEHEFRALVAGIADECGLEATTMLKDGRFCVRFVRADTLWADWRWRRGCRSNSC